MHGGLGTILTSVAQPGLRRGLLIIDPWPLLFQPQLTTAAGINLEDVDARHQVVAKRSFEHRLAVGDEGGGERAEGDRDIDSGVVGHPQVLAGFNDDAARVGDPRLQAHRDFIAAGLGADSGGRLLGVRRRPRDGGGRNFRRREQRAGQGRGNRDDSEKGQSKASLYEILPGTIPRNTG